MRVTTRGVLWWSTIAVGLFLGIGAIFALRYMPTDRAIRKRVEELLAKQFDATVELQDLHVSLVPVPRIEGGGLKLFPHNRPGSAPFLEVKRFHGRATWHELLWPTHRVDTLDLEGLRITIVPKASDTGVRDKEHGGCQGERRHPLDAPRETAGPHQYSSRTCRRQARRSRSCRAIPRSCRASSRSSR